MNFPDRPPGEQYGTWFEEVAPGRWGYREDRTVRSMTEEDVRWALVSVATRQAEVLGKRVERWALYETPLGYEWPRTIGAKWWLV